MSRATIACGQHDKRSCTAAAAPECSTPWRGSNPSRIDAPLNSLISPVARLHSLSYRFEPMTAMEDRDALTRVALAVAQEAAALVLRGWRSRPTFERKANYADLVTEHDLASERLIRRLLAERTPNLPIVGEEIGRRAQRRADLVLRPDRRDRELHPWASFLRRQHRPLGAWQTGVQCSGGAGPRDRVARLRRRRSVWQRQALPGEPDRQGCPSR